MFGLSGDLRSRGFFFVAYICVGNLTQQDGVMDWWFHVISGLYFFQSSIIMGNAWISPFD